MSSPDRKENVVKTLLLESTLANDWNMLKIILKQCWNKTRLFQDTYDEDGDSLLHITCRENYLESTKVLIEHGLSVDYRNSHGDTCLHITARNENGVILHLLFEAGANAITKNNDDKQPVDMTDNREIKELLRQYSLRSAELQLMKKFNTLKEIIAEEERKEQYDLINQKYFEDYASDKFLSNAVLERNDSGICSDIDSTEKLECECPDDRSTDNADDELSRVQGRVRSLHISSPKTVGDTEVNSRSCRSGCEQWNYVSILKVPTTSTSSSVRFDTKDKQLTKTKSYETGSRRRKSSDNSIRKKRLSLPDFRIHGSTESYV